MSLSSCNPLPENTLHSHTLFLCFTFWWGTRIGLPQDLEILLRGWNPQDLEDYVVEYMADSLLLQFASLIAYYMSNPKVAGTKVWPKVVTLAYSHVDTHLFLKSFYIQRTKLMTIKEINTTILDIKYSNASTFEQTPWLVSPPNSFFLSIPTSYQKQKKKLKLGILMMGSKNCKGFTV